MRIEAESFSWVWQTTFVGYRMSAELLSQHLILPMISVVHFTLGGQESIVDMPDDDLEKVRHCQRLFQRVRHGLRSFFVLFASQLTLRKVVDKVARTARRTPGTHVRNAIAKPRAATCLSRMSAMLNFTEPPRESPNYHQNTYPGPTPFIPRCLPFASHAPQNFLFLTACGRTLSTLSPCFSRPCHPFRSRLHHRH